MRLPALSISRRGTEEYCIETSPEFFVALISDIKSTFTHTQTPLHRQLLNYSTRLILEFILSTTVTPSQALKYQTSQHFRIFIFLDSPLLGFPQFKYLASFPLSHQFLFLSIFPMDVCFPSVSYSAHFPSSSKFLLSAYMLICTSGSYI